MSKTFEKDLAKVVVDSKKTVGWKETQKAIKNDTINFVIVSTNIDSSLEKVILTECSINNISVKRAFTKQDLGKLTCLEVSCAVVGILK